MGCTLISDYNVNKKISEKCIANVIETRTTAMCRGSVTKYSDKPYENVHCESITFRTTPLTLPKQKLQLFGCNYNGTEAKKMSNYSVKPKVTLT